MRDACNQYGIIMQSACNQHAISMQPACNQHATSMQSGVHADEGGGDVSSGEGFGVERAFAKEALGAAL